MGFPGGRLTVAAFRVISLTLSTSRVFSLSSRSPPHTQGESSGLHITCTRQAEGRGPSRKVPIYMSVYCSPSSLNLSKNSCLNWKSFVHGHWRVNVPKHRSLAEIWNTLRLVICMFLALHGCEIVEGGTQEERDWTGSRFFAAVVSERREGDKSGGDTSVGGDISPGGKHLELRQAGGVGQTNLSSLNHGLLQHTLRRFQRQWRKKSLSKAAPRGLTFSPRHFLPIFLSWELKCRTACNLQGFWPPAA